MHKLLAALPFAAALIFFACTKQEPVDGIPPQEQKNHTAPSPLLQSKHWMYFAATEDNTSIELKYIDAVSEIPAVPFKPWTEAVRVADFCLHQNKAVFLINKCGALPLQSLQSDKQLSNKKSVCESLTAGGLYTVNGELFIRVYQNTAFLPHGSENIYFLMHSISGTNECEPVADITNLQFPENAQCKSLEQINGQWYASFKADNGKKISFFYVTCNTFTNFLQKDAYKTMKRLSAESFRKTCAPPLYTQMPDTLKNLADTIKNNTALYFKVWLDGTAHSALFLKSAQNASSTMLEESLPQSVYALHRTDSGGAHTAAILLPDGTFLLDKKKGGIITLQLPSLPENFRYTAFFVSDTAIIAAWEESAFYQVGRAGFFSAQLQELETYKRTLPPQ